MEPPAARRSGGCTTPARPAAACVGQSRAPLLWWMLSSLEAFGSLRHAAECVLSSSVTDALGFQHRCKGGKRRCPTNTTKAVAHRRPAHNPKTTTNGVVKPKRTVKPKTPKRTIKPKTAVKPRRPAARKPVTRIPAKSKRGAKPVAKVQVICCHSYLLIEPPCYPNAWFTEARRDGSSLLDVIRPFSRHHVILIPTD